MLSKAMQDAINKQINAEISSAYSLTCRHEGHRSLLAEATDRLQNVFVVL